MARRVGRTRNRVSRDVGNAFSSPHPKCKNGDSFSTCGMTDCWLAAEGERRGIDRVYEKTGAMMQLDEAVFTKVLAVE